MTRGKTGEETSPLPFKIHNSKLFEEILAKAGRLMGNSFHDLKVVAIQEDGLPLPR